MGSNLNFQNFVTDPPPETGNFPLTRQHSVYSLTFDEFQSTVGGIGKDFGSMNMDELLKNIWSAEENQIVGSTSGNNINGQNIQEEGSGYLQRQGSLTLPRTLSQKTVDEVWRGMSKDPTGGIISGFGAPPQKQPTLGEITLEEFLVRAGVVKEEAQLEKPKTAGFFGDFSRPVNNNPGFEFGYQNQGRGTTTTAGLMGGRMAESSSNQIAMQSANLMLNVNGARSAAAAAAAPHQHTVQPQILPKQPPTLSYGAAMGIPSSLGSQGIRGGIMGIQDVAMNGSMVHNVTLQGLGVNNGVSVPTGSPTVSSDGLTKSNGDTSSVSPVPYAFNGGLRGRKSAALEKVVERRQRRMIKNRESAARSRARKQAYTMELEAEVAKLKEENEELRKSQAEMMEIQKNQVMEMMNEQKGNKRRCLRRTQTGPW